MKKIILLMALAVIISGAFTVYTVLDADNVPFTYVFRVFVPGAGDNEPPYFQYVIKSETDYENLQQKLSIDVIVNDNVDFTKDFLFVTSGYGARPYFTLSQTIKRIKINGAELQFVYSKDYSTEIFADYYFSDTGDFALGQRYTEVIMISNKYLKYVKDFTVYSK